MKKNKELFKFLCKNCGKQFEGNPEKSNENWCVCTKDDRCECGGEYKEETTGEIEYGIDTIKVTGLRIDADVTNVVFEHECGGH